MAGVRCGAIAVSVRSGFQAGSSALKEDVRIGKASGTVPLGRC